MVVSSAVSARVANQAMPPRIGRRHPCLVKFGGRTIVGRLVLGAVLLVCRGSLPGWTRRTGGPSGPSAVRPVVWSWPP
jgi:hypothetical protein